jgi:hypothetical protein
MAHPRTTACDEIDRSHKSAGSATKAQEAPTKVQCQSVLEPSPPLFARDVLARTGANLLTS